MGWEAIATGVLLIGMMGVLFTSRFGPDLVLMGVVVTMLVLGILEPREAVVGFSNTGVITVAMLYIVAAGLKETGAMAMLASRLLGKPKTEFAARARMAGPVAVMSAFVNNTPIVAMFLPVLSGWARRNNIAPSRLFLPLSYAAILGGVCTLIGTSTNLVIAGLLIDHNRLNPDLPALREFGMFTITWVGLPMAAVGLVYVIIAGKWLLPAREAVLADTTQDSREYTSAMRVAPDSPVVGQTVEQAGLRGLPGLFLSRIERGSESILAVGPEQRVLAEDVLVFVGRLESIVDLQRIKGLIPLDSDERPVSQRQINRLVEVVISPSSPLVGQSIREGGFRSRYGGVVVAVHRHGARLRGKLGDIVLRAGDTLLIEAPSNWAAVHGDSTAFHLVSEVPDSSPLRHERGWIAIIILLALMVTITAGWLDTMAAAMAAAGAMVVTRCCTGPQARASLDWQVLIVIGAAFGIGRAMEKTGLAGLISESALGWAVDLGPVALLATIYMVTVLFTQLITNNAAAILVFPIALEAARAGNLEFLPFAVCIAVGASCEFMTPIGYQTNLMVMGPGGYKWLDYLRFGTPLQVICFVVCVSAASVVYGPLQGVAG